MIRKSTMSVRFLYLFFVLSSLCGCGLLPLSSKQIAEKVLPSLVTIVTQDCEGSDLAIGSGFFIAPDLIATNLHVLKRADNAYVKSLAEDMNYKIDKVVGLSRKHDLCLIKLVSAKGNALPLSTKDISVGDEIYAAGNPQGLEGTLSKGIISAIRNKSDFIQLDAAISAGSSGGPVVNGRCEVVGIVVSTLVTGQNLNFAVPVEFLAKMDKNLELPICDVAYWASNDLEREQLRGPVKSVTVHNLIDMRGLKRTYFNVLGDITKKVYPREETLDANGMQITIEFNDNYIPVSENSIIDIFDQLTPLVKKYGANEKEILETLPKEISEQERTKRKPYEIFDCNGRLLKSENCVYRYRDDGLQDESQCTNMIFKYEYEFDPLGNWVSKKRILIMPTDGSQTLLDGQRREIEYYGY